MASTRGCSAPRLFPGVERDSTANVDWVTLGPGGARGPQRLPLVKPPYGTITAIDLNTGDHIWQIPNGTTPDRIRDHPALAGVDIGNTGAPAHATKLVTRNLLMYGEGRGAAPIFRAVDKITGEELGAVELPGSTITAPMTYMHEGSQYVAVAIRLPDGEYGLVALRLPE